MKPCPHFCVWRGFPALGRFMFGGIIIVRPTSFHFQQQSRTITMQIPCAPLDVAILVPNGQNWGWFGSLFVFLTIAHWRIDFIHRRALNHFRPGWRLCCHRASQFALPRSERGLPCSGLLCVPWMAIPTMAREGGRATPRTNTTPDNSALCGHTTKKTVTRSLACCLLLSGAHAWKHWVCAHVVGNCPPTSAFAGLRCGETASYCF